MKESLIIEYELSGPHWIGHFPFGKCTGYHYEWFVSVPLKGSVKIEELPSARDGHVFIVPQENTWNRTGHKNLHDAVKMATSLFKKDEKSAIFTEDREFEINFG